MEVTLVGATTPRQMPMDSSGNTSITAPATGNSIYKDSIICVFQLTSAAAAVAVIEGSLDNTNWCPITGTTATSTITLSGAGTGALVEYQGGSAWRYVRCRTTTATAATTCLMGV
jgi:hypothetical protein